MGKKNYDNDGGSFKDILKGVLFAAGGGLLIIIGVAGISILPLAIVLWVLGCPLLVNGLRIIIKYVKNKLGKSSNSSNSSSYDNSPSPSSPRRYRHPRQPEPEPDEYRVSHAQVYKAVRYLSYGQVRVADAYVSETGPNLFDIELTLTNATGETDRLDAHAHALMDQAQITLEEMGVSGNLNAHFE